MAVASAQWHNNRACKACSARGPNAVGGPKFARRCFLKVFLGKRGPFWNTCTRAHCNLVTPLLSPSSIVYARHRAVMSYGWEGNRGSSITLAIMSMGWRLNEWDEHHACASRVVWHYLPLLGDLRDQISVTLILNESNKVMMLIDQQHVLVWSDGVNSVAVSCELLSPSCSHYTYSNS